MHRETSEQWYLSQYSDEDTKWKTCGLGFDFRQWQRFFRSRLRPVIHSDTYPVGAGMGGGSIPAGEVTTHLYLVP
jgi:hypothetical protein